MASISEQEIDKIITSVPDIIGAELTSLSYDEKVLQLRFEKPERYWWVGLSLKPGAPYFFVASSRIFLARSLKKPLTIFLRTHFVGQQLTGLARDTESGRVVELTFADGKKIRATLFMGGQNIELQAEGKNIFAYKPKEIKKKNPELGPDTEPKGERRDPSFFVDLWQAQNKKKSVTGSAKDPSSQQKKDLKKKEKGLVKMQEKLEEYKNSPWQELGDWLKSHQSLENIPDQWESLVDSDNSLSWNIENSFNQHKKNQTKIQGTLDRIDELEKEIEKLKTQPPPKKHKAQPSLMVQSEAKGRTFQAGDFRIYIGKSAKDNLNLLRKAKPWYQWLHIRDYPGAYGIIESQKKQKIPLSTLQQAAQMVIKQSVGDKAEGSYQVIIAECRYVKPIKGAKAGQVTYSHEKVISVRV